MHLNGSHPPASSAMEQRCRAVLQRFNRHLGRLAKGPAIDDVHKFRTHSRRVEGIISNCGPNNGNQEKLLKLLSKLRKKAGKVRDLDVEVVFLQNLKVPDRNNHRGQLLDWLADEQARRSKKLRKTASSENVQEIRKRLRRLKSEMQL